MTDTMNGGEKVCIILRDVILLLLFSSVSCFFDALMLTDNVHTPGLCFFGAFNIALPGSCYREI